MPDGIYTESDFTADLSVLGTFKQVNEPITMQAPNGGECSPFQEVSDKYPEGMAHQHAFIV